jgi:hypothetical protein
METGTKSWMLAAVCAAAAACSTQPQARQPESETTAATAGETTPGPSGAAPAASSAAQAQPQPGEEFAVPSVADVCEKLCVRADQECTKDSATKCRASCDRYSKLAERCENDVRRSLQCQMKAKKEFICSAQADPKCEQTFRGMRACEKGETGAGQGTVQNFALPGTWTKVTDDQLKFTVSMPPGAQLDPKAERRTWRGEDNGITYFVAQLDPPKDKPDKAFLPMAIAYVGGKCQLGIKLHGRFESHGKLLMQWDSGCPDKSEWHGAIHIWEGKAVATAYHGPAGSKGVMEPFFYSLVRTD